jgi:hypothetical protein
LRFRAANSIRLSGDGAPPLEGEFCDRQLGVASSRWISVSRRLHSRSAMRSRVRQWAFSRSAVEWAWSGEGMRSFALALEFKFGSFQVVGLGSIIGFIWFGCIVIHSLLFFKNNKKNLLNLEQLLPQIISVHWAVPFREIQSGIKRFNGRWGK